MTTKPKTEPTLPQSIEAFHRSLFSSGNAGSLATVSRGEYPRDCALAKELAKRYNAHDALVLALSNIVANAVVGPDASMKGLTDCYHIPLDDIEAAGDALRAAGEKP